MGASTSCLTSETLEHVPDPATRPARDARVLRPGQAGTSSPSRSTRSLDGDALAREGLPAEHHGRGGGPFALVTRRADMLVHTDFGRDLARRRPRRGLRVRDATATGMELVVDRDPTGGRRVSAGRTALDHRHRRPGRLVPLGSCSSVATRSSASFAGRPTYHPALATRAGPMRVRRGRPARSRLARRAPFARRGPRGLQPRRPVVRAALVGRAGSDGRVRRRRRDVAPRGDPRGGSVDSPLSGLLERDLRRSRGLPQTEETPLWPVTPYGVAKAYAHFITASYRRALRHVHVLRDPLQPRVPATATRLPPAQSRGAAAAISLGLETELLLGDLDARRDWGYARTMSARCG